MKKKDLSLVQINEIIKETVSKIDNLIEVTNAKLPKGFDLIILKDSLIMESKLSFAGKHCSVGSVIDFSATYQKSTKKNIKKHQS